MNLFDLHLSKSEHEDDKDLIPKLAWEKFQTVAGLSNVRLDESAQ